MRNDVYKKFHKQLLEIARKCIVPKKIGITDENKYSHYKAHSTLLENNPKFKDTYIDRQKAIECRDDLVNIFSQLPRTPNLKKLSNGHTMAERY